ncbi:Glutathione gamma-glutamylcysteinyltransferase [Phytophthora megakarya]|uniref:glutathione gamma-glutamylcysteinyltransferase n=1 Tax=Phytophthora megakarya TaxID=4795 RepID=A0A225WRU3_9STRA|nr:Glutathione gamma-glutamylcysteinyltransferase [Phytophthora megakarya]
MENCCECKQKQEENTNVKPLQVQQTDNPQTSPTIQNSFHRRHLPEGCIAFSSSEGRKLFMEAINSSDNYMQIYFPLAEQFITQAEPAYCGLATLAMCLNALQIDPGRLWKGPWRWFSEELLDCCKPLSVAKEKGISLTEFVCLARCNGVLAEDYRATNDFTLEQFRDIVKQSCATSSEIVVLNYSRKVLGQTGDGHFSPIGGYHAERDMVLLMDVARFKYPPHWVKLFSVHVFEAMRLVVKAMNKPRGLVILRENPHATDSTLLQLKNCNQENCPDNKQGVAAVGSAPRSCCYRPSAAEASAVTNSSVATQL